MPFLAIGLFLLRFASVIKSVAWAGIMIFAGLPNWAKTVLLVAAALVAVYYVGERRGAERIQTKWDAAVSAASISLEKASQDAVSKADASVPPVSAADRATDNAIAPRGVPCRVFDRFDRSCAGRSR